VLDAIGCRERAAIWHSMREEPLVYVNGEPFVLREVEAPFSNLECVAPDLGSPCLRPSTRLTGITCKRVEAMEARLREDVLAEVARYGGRVLVSRELDDGQLVSVWEQCTSVQTPKEVFEALVAEGYQLQYLRVPVTDERAPKAEDCDTIARCCATADTGALFIFNCQMGRGRTTTAMVIASLVYLRVHGGAHNLPPLPVPPPAPADDDLPLRRGDYAVIRALLRVVDGGPAAKEMVDEVRLRFIRRPSLIAL